MRRVTEWIGHRSKEEELAKHTPKRWNHLGGNMENKCVFDKAKERWGFKKMKLKNMY